MRKAPSQVTISLGLFKYMLLATLRNRNSLVFGLLFPLIFVLIFGSFGSGISKSKVAVSERLASSQSPFLKALMHGPVNGALSIETMDDSQLERAVRDGSVGAGIEPGREGREFTIVASST